MPDTKFVSKYNKIEFNYNFFDSNTQEFIFDSTSIVFNGLGDIDDFIKNRIDAFLLIGLEVYSYSISDITEVRTKTVILKEGSEQIEI